MPLADIARFIDLPAGPEFTLGSERFSRTTTSYPRFAINIEIKLPHKPAPIMFIFCLTTLDYFSWIESDRRSIKWKTS